ncbi:MAG: PQQ-binding-like beta-propeller repeat protein, partial [Planctomycetaceae bacterium]|nr:PQQ-binding-like beta-propeller repeat protein [Planctomycetaceae bacterium]
WPMWRYDASRTATSPESLPRALHLQWVRELPSARPAYREARLQFDAGYEPIVLGNLIYLASSRTDGVVALDTETGEEKWSFFTEGPVRFAPAAWQDRVFFGSDDGHIYCVRAKSGELLWKFRAVPSQRKVLGNGRMIALWPVRGGTVVHKGKVYFAAGVWPLEGVFIYCLDGLTGEVVWRNEECSYLYGTQPHAAEALGGVTPQGYLVVAGEELIVPCGQALPARLNLKTGKLRSFELPRPGRQPGGWFASVEARRGLVVMDATINRDLHEDKVYQGPGSPEVRSTITLNGKTHRFSDKWPSEVKAPVHTLFAANGKLFIVDQKARLYCFGPKQVDSPRRYELPAPKAGKRNNTAIAKSVKRILQFTPVREGFVCIRGIGGFDAEAHDWLQAFQQQARFHLVVTDSNETLLDQLRRRQSLNRDHLDLLKDENGSLDLPPYFASLIFSETPPTLEHLNCLRPYDGVGCFSISEIEHEKLRTQLEASPSEGFAVTRENGWTVIRRGALPGAANYRGGWSSPDERVRAPVGVLWFDDALGHFKRSPQPWFVDGVMVSYPKDWMEKHRANKKPPYRLLPPVFSDVYTG